MPVHKVKLPDGSTGYQWGRTGKIYKDPRKAYAQGAAIEHSGWKQKKAQYSIQEPVLVSKLPQQKREAVAKLIQGLQRDMPTVTPIQWQRTTVQRILQRLDKDQQQAAIAYHKGQPVAAATGGIDQKSSQAFFNNLYVAQKHRGKGLARRLLQKLEQRAADAGIQRAFLHVTANNPARRLYRQLGYMPQSLALYKQLQKQNDGLSQQRRMLQQVAQTAQTAGLPIFAVTDGASITRNNGSQAVRRARQAHAQYQRSAGDDPDQDWGTQKKAALRQPKSVQDLDRMYDKITYGLVDFQAGKPWRKTHRSTTQQDWDDNWKLLTPQQIRQYKAAICWDAARFNHHVLDKLGIQHRSLFAHSQRDANAQYNYDPTHSFTVYKGADNKWHWLQGSWQPYRHNNAVADTADQLIQHVGQLLTEASGQPQYIGQITQWPQYGTGMTAFYKYMLDQVRRNKLLQTAMQEQGIQKKAQDYTKHGFFYTYRNPRPAASTQQVQKLKEILGVYPSVHRIAGQWNGQNAQPNACYVGTSWSYQPASVKENAQRGYTLKDYETYDKLPQQHARQHGIILHTDGQNSLGIMAHELGHAKDRQMQPFLYGLRPNPAYKYTNPAIGLGIIAAGLGMFGSNISEYLAASPKLRKALLIGGGTVAAGAYAWQQLAPWLGARLSRARQRRASLHGLYALKKMGLTAQQLQQQLKDRNAYLQTYGARPVSLNQVDTFAKNRFKYAFDW